MRKYYPKAKAVYLDNSIEAGIAIQIGKLNGYASTADCLALKILDRGIMIDFVNQNGKSVSDYLERKPIPYTMFWNGQNIPAFRREKFEFLEQKPIPDHMFVNREYIPKIRREEYCIGDFVRRQGKIYLDVYEEQCSIDQDASLLFLDITSDLLLTTNIEIFVDVDARGRKKVSIINPSTGNTKEYEITAEVFSQTQKDLRNSVRKRKELSPEEFIAKQPKKAIPRLASKMPKQETKFNKSGIKDDAEKVAISPIAELNSLIGLSGIKREVNSLINYVNIQQQRQKKGYRSSAVSLHMVFSGNPGTGKTTVARLLAQIYKQIGVLSKGQVVEVERASLVAEYVGQTAIKTKEKIDEAMGGILFIDEAYTLTNSGHYDFGQESVDTILKAMEDNRSDFIVIVAGYTELMKGFINSNPGLKSRFTRYMFFEDYTENELFEIFSKMCRDDEYILNHEAEIKVKAIIREMVQKKGENFGNAREIRNLLQDIKVHQANRIAQEGTITDQALITLIGEDIY